MKQVYKAWRAEFRENVFRRDNYKCVMCKSKDGLDAHHITDRKEMPHDGYAVENGISLCSVCHLKAEEWHKSEKKIYIPDYHPDQLYARINSSYDKAYKASLDLKMDL